jgi:hypothetical protein
VLLFATTFLYLARDEIVAHTTSLSEWPQNTRPSRCSIRLIADEMLAIPRTHDTQQHLSMGLTTSF